MRHPVLFLLALMACSGGLKDERFPTGSDTIAATARYDAVVAVNTDEGTISRLDLETDEVVELVVGAEPTRIARAGKRFFVTLRADRAVAVVSEDFEVEKIIPTGAEPFGVVATENGRRVYVALSQSSEVVEIDARQLTKLRAFKVQDEPRWLALHPSDRSLYVGSAFMGRLTHIDLRSGDRERIELPEATRMIDDESHVELTERITGDMAITPDGKRLLVPTVYVDNTTPVEEPVEGRPVQNGYGADGMSLGRINPAVVRLPLDRNGSIRSGEDPLAIFIGAFLQDDLVRSYPSSLTASPDSQRVAVTMEASDAVVVVNLNPFRNQGDDPSSRGASASEPAIDVVEDTGGFMSDRTPITLPSSGGMFERPVVAIGTSSRGPIGVVFVEKERALVHSFIDREVADLHWATFSEIVSDIARSGFSSERQPKASRGIVLAEKSLPTEVEAGRSLFYSAVDDRMAGPGAGVSCSTCHFDGRTDGLTWTFEQGPRQTPSLAGFVSGTAPVTWTNEVASVADEALLTTSLRMGGDALGSAHADDIQAYVDWTREVDVHDKGSTEAAVERGREIFNRSEVGCATCHSGDQLTDNQSYALFGDTPMNTPSLLGLSATPPYLHDGSAKTLSDVLGLAAAGLMGDVSSLTRQELTDLERYLASL